jgi:DNA-binding transcriptional regulator YhcF (GntR family)
VDSPDPPYVRIAAELHRRIATGELSPGARLPSARQITQEWGVAIATATKALATLRRAGLVRPVPGVGTVVAERAVPTGTPKSRDVDAGPTRDDVVRTAIRVADAEGLAAVSMRRVAAELDVATMSLYRHVSGKDELLLLMADAVFGEEPPVEDGLDWRAAMESMGRALWTLCRRHPWIARITSFTRPMLAPNGMAHTEGAMRALDGLGLDLSTRLYLVIALTGFVIGTAVNLEAEIEAQHDTGVSSDEWMHAQESAFNAIVASGRFPLMTALAAQPDFDVHLDPLFELGLKLMVDGLAAFIAEQQ